MKICHVIYRPRLSGAEILVRDLAIVHNSMGHEVSVCSIEPPEDSFNPMLKVMQVNKVELFLPDRRLSKVSRLRFLIQSLRKISPDVIVAHSTIPSAYTRLALKFKKLASIPVVTVLHDASQDDYASFYLRTIEKFLKPSNYIIPLTNNSLENYRKRCGKISKVKIILNGIDLQGLSASTLQREHIRQDIFKVKTTDPIFLQVGRFSRSKQQHLSIKAFIDACQNKLFKGNFFLVGLIEDREYFSQLEGMIEESELQNRIIILGPRSDVFDLLSAADAYLMPSLIEAHSIAFLEALGSGITMVVSDITAFAKGRQFDGVNFLQPNETQKFAQILMDISCGVRWNRNISEFSILKTADTYLEIFQSLVKP